jgi:hypothetical protein
MPVYDCDYRKTPEATRERRATLIRKWREKGCTEQKISELIQRRMRSRRQWW